MFNSFFAVLVFYLVDVELALASGQFSVAGGELSDKVVTGRKIDLVKNRRRGKTEENYYITYTVYMFYLFILHQRHDS